MSINGIKIALIASGSGTDAKSIIDAYKTLGRKRKFEIACLVSTKKAAGCIKMARDRRIKTKVIDRKSYVSLDDFNKDLKDYLLKNKVNLVFLVGCISKIYPIDSITMYNIHPAEIPKHGGKGMYGLEPHKSVLQEILNDHGWAGNVEGRYFTQPTIHEVITEYDSGRPLLTGNVEIPRHLMIRLFDKEISLDEAAAELQQIVLPVEHMMLPAAVNMAVERILNEEVEE